MKDKKIIGYFGAILAFSEMMKVNDDHKRIVDDITNNFKTQRQRGTKKIDVYRQAKVRTGSKIGRNSICDCGSQKKYKNCCIKK